MQLLCFCMYVLACRFTGCRTLVVVDDIIQAGTREYYPWQRCHYGRRSTGEDQLAEHGLVNTCRLLYRGKKCGGPCIAKRIGQKTVV